MKEGASIVSEESQHVADLLLVVELCEGELRHAKNSGNQGRTIIFSTIPLEIIVNIRTRKTKLVSTDLVSPSRSLSLLFSGWIFLVSILGW
jgi:hypothetical protein